MNLTPPVLPIEAGQQEPSELQIAIDELAKAEAELGKYGYAVGCGARGRIEGSRRKLQALAALQAPAQKDAQAAQPALREAPAGYVRERAPWNDFAGQPIFHGDVLVHPGDGSQFVAIMLPGVAEPSAAWKAIYVEGRQPSSLCLQIGEMGQAVLAKPLVFRATFTEHQITCVRAALRLCQPLVSQPLIVTRVTEAIDLLTLKLEDGNA